jgi:hypothetical protein
VICFKFFIQNFRRLKIFTHEKIQIPPNPIFKFPLPPPTKFTPLLSYPNPQPSRHHWPISPTKNFPQKPIFSPHPKPAKDFPIKILPIKRTQIGAQWPTPMVNILAFFVQILTFECWMFFIELRY